MYSSNFIVTYKATTKNITEKRRLSVLCRLIIPSSTLTAAAIGTLAPFKFKLEMKIKNQLIFKYFFFALLTAGAGYCYRFYDKLFVGFFYCSD